MPKRTHRKYTSKELASKSMNELKKIQNELARQSNDWKEDSSRMDRKQPIGGGGTRQQNTPPKKKQPDVGVPWWLEDNDTDCPSLPDIGFDGWGCSSPTDCLSPQNPGRNIPDEWECSPGGCCHPVFHECDATPGGPGWHNCDWGQCYCDQITGDLLSNNCTYPEMAVCSVTAYGYASPQIDGPGGAEGWWGDPQTYQIGPLGGYGCSCVGSSTTFMNVPMTEKGGKLQKGGLTKPKVTTKKKSKNKIKQDNKKSYNKPTSIKKVAPLKQTGIGSNNYGSSDTRTDCWGWCEPNENAQGGTYCIWYPDSCDYDFQLSPKYCSQINSAQQCNTCNNSSSCGDPSTGGCSWYTVSESECKDTHCPDYCEHGRYVMRSAGCTAGCDCYEHEEFRDCNDSGEYSECVCTGPNCWCSPNTPPEGTYTGPMEQQAGQSGDMGNIYNDPSSTMGCKTAQICAESPYQIEDEDGNLILYCDDHMGWACEWQGTPEDGQCIMVEPDCNDCPDCTFVDKSQCDGYTANEKFPYSCGGGCLFERDIYNQCCDTDEWDECQMCNGPGAMWDCGEPEPSCYEIPPDNDEGLVCTSVGELITDEFVEEHPNGFYRGGGGWDHGEYECTMTEVSLTYDYDCDSHDCNWWPYWTCRCRCWQGCPYSKYCYSGGNIVEPMKACGDEYDCGSGQTCEQPPITNWRYTAGGASDGCSSNCGSLNGSNSSWCIDDCNAQCGFTSMDSEDPWSCCLSA